ncbi:hypothetical protein LWI29_032144 [Acer saccharum]|uniref:Uncharacterized protein n=1 Tax=Acer saccharum TaxID=4024 RepID=A0AA39STT4_ACESA|nr:hypothetical protein LWI29_032144 [Acer saccharum]
MLQQEAESTGGVQPPNHGKNMPSNLGETSHQPQLSEAQIAVADFSNGVGSGHRAPGFVLRRLLKLLDGVVTTHSSVVANGDVWND